MFLVGLTGGIASGKSTVVKEFKRLGCPCIDADMISREVVEPGQLTHAKIRATFGDEIFHIDNRLNRERLGQIIFQDEVKRKQLNAIMHPAIKQRMLWNVFLYFIKGNRFVILDVPLLFETQQILPFVSFTIVVNCTHEQQLERLMKRNNMSEEDATARMNSQLALKDKCKRCTFIIDNTGSCENTKDLVQKLFAKLTSSKKHWILRLVILSLLSVLVGGIYHVL